MKLEIQNNLQCLVPFDWSWGDVGYQASNQPSLQPLPEGLPFLYIHQEHPKWYMHAGSPQWCVWGLSKGQLQQAAVHHHGIESKALSMHQGNLCTEQRIVWSVTGWDSHDVVSPCPWNQSKSMLWQAMDPAGNDVRHPQWWSSYSHLLRITQLKNPAIKMAYHKIVLPHPAVVIHQNLVQITHAIEERTNSMKPKEKIQFILPLWEIGPFHKPCASCRLSFLARIVMVWGGIRCLQPFMDLPARIICKRLSVSQFQSEKICNTDLKWCHVYLTQSSQLTVSVL